MPAGTLNLNIDTLRSALEGISGLLGSSEEGQPLSGFAGAASILSTSPQQHFDNVGSQISTQLTGVLDFNASASLGNVTGLLGSLDISSDLVPTQALEGLNGLIQQADSGFSGDFLGQIQNALNSVTGLSQSIPTDRAGVASALVDQIIGILMSLEGPEAEAIRAWITSIQNLHHEAMPLIELAQSGDPQQALVQAFERSLGRTLKAFNYDAIKKVVDFVQTFPPKLTVQAQTADLAALVGSASLAIGNAQGLVGGDLPSYRAGVAAGLQALENVRATLRPVNRVIRKIVDAKMLQPNALENYLREQMDKALAVQVHEVQKIDDPYNALLDRIDGAIENIDLSFVRDEVLGFFDGLQENINGVDIPSLGDFLQQQLAPVNDAVSGLQDGVSGFLEQIAAFSDNTKAQLRSGLGSIGEFGADGEFHYHFEQELTGILQNARTVVSGDPNNPDAFSLSGTISEFNTTITDLLSQVNDLLTEVQGIIEGVTNTAVGGITSFKDFVEGLDVPSLLETLKQKITEMLDALAPIEFDVIVDPIVDELDENTEKLHSVDTSSLNDLLKEALKLALDVVINIDFTVEISTPLKEQFANVKAIPQAAMDVLQDRYEQAIKALDDLSPTQLLKAIFDVFDVIENALKDIDAAMLLQPLDELHDRYLQQPLQQLAPSTLLQPLSANFSKLTGVFDTVGGDQLLAPLNTVLDEFKTKVADFDVTGWIDDLIAAVDKVKQDLNDIRPSELFQPIVEDFQRLESELDRFKPSVVFQPVVDLAAPLLGFLEDVQETAVQALHDAFQIPLQVLEQLQPQAITDKIQEHIDEIIAGLNSINLPVIYNQLKAQYFDFNVAVQANGNQAYLSISAHLNPDRKLAEVMATYNGLVQALEAIKDNVVMPDLEGLYNELQERLLAMLPPYARELLDTETFKRIMRLANPVRFLEDLDARYEEIKNRLIPIRPEDITAELDETYDTVLAMVENLDVTDALNEVKDQINQIKNIVSSIRVDFLAADIDDVINDVKSVVEALNPAGVISRLDVIHTDLQQVVAQTKPSEMLSGIDTTLNQAKEIIALLDPETSLGQPLDEAWQAVTDALADVDFTVVLQPLMDKLDELEAKFELGLSRTEDAFDNMLGAAKGALGGGAGASASVSI